MSGRPWISPPRSLPGAVQWLGESACPSCGGRSRATAVGRPNGREIFAAIHPGGLGSREPAAQVAGLQSQLLALLAEIGPRQSAVVSEAWFVSGEAAAALSEQHGQPGAAGGALIQPASTRVVLPPCCDRCQAGLQAHIVAWEPPGAEFRAIPPHGNAVIDQRGRRHIRIADILGGAGGGSFEEECLRMFESAEELLRREGSSFREVVRTWFFLRDMDRDYAALNSVRNGFFERTGVELHPASTGIGGAPAAEGARISLALYAISPVAGINGRERPEEFPSLAPITSPTFNEASEYGSLFSRGIRVDSGMSATLFLSGTASIDQEGRSVGAGEFDVQVDRMLLNLRGLLAGAGAGYGNAVQAVSYLKSRGSAPRFRRRLEDSGLLDIPHTIVEGQICRPELLCEMELIAIL